MHLSRADTDTILKTMYAYQEKRNRTQPVASQSAGCVFANPPGDSAGRLIDSCGLKGTRVGGAVVSDLHGNYILSEGASSGEVLELIALVRRKVHEKSGVELHTEMVVW
jgi:UDP-N-acetylmuramate dehydrogenase